MTIAIIAFALIVGATLFSALFSKDPAEKRKASTEIIVTVLMVIGFAIFMIFQITKDFGGR
jgi:hypothetical protein